LSAISLRSDRPAAGFSLVEIMVGMAIGMIGILVMMQVFSVFEGDKRTTTSGDDAQNNGAIAVYELQRNIRPAGLGIATLDILGCDVLLRAGVTLPSIGPVVINPLNAAGSVLIPAGDSGTDTLLVVYGTTSSASPQGDSILSSAANQYKPATPTSYKVGDWLIAATDRSTNLLTYKDLCRTALGNVPLKLESVQSLTPAPPQAPVTVNVTTGSGTGFLYNLGNGLRIQAYAVRGGRLTVCDYLAHDCGDAGNVGNSDYWLPIADNIVSLRAQYGRDAETPAKSSPLIDDMYRVTATYDQATPTTACGWNRVLALRLALVARNGQYDKDRIVTTAAPSWAGSADVPIDLSGGDAADDAQWKHYRYKLFETMVPLRNIAWMGMRPTC
jgi:type IV pilus assembly protein PilW